jgi:TRAP-type uncharacterized transport system substrate-binding protein
MQRAQWQALAVGAGVVAAIVAIATGRMPRWLRIALVLGITIIALGGGLYVYRNVTNPTTLTVAAGSFDGDAVQLMSTIATRLTSTSAPIRLNVLDKGSALDAFKAFSDGAADLAIVRSDIGDLSSAETVVVITRGVLLIVALSGTSITDMDSLKGKTVGVVGGAVNRQVVAALTREYELAGTKTQFKDLAVADIPQAIKSKQVSALLVVMPITDKYLTLLRGLFPKSVKQQPALVPIESADAIAAVTRYYQSYSLPKGSVQGSPPIPDDDMKTLHVPFYLVANKKLSSNVVASLAQAIMDARRDLIGAYPLVAQISEPDTDKTDSDNDTYLPVHPGAAAYFSGNVQSFFDKYGDQIFYGSMLLGTLTSLFAAAWKFMSKDADSPQNKPLMRLYALADQIGNAGNEADLSEAERRIDEILKAELEKCATGQADATESAALGLATHRLEHLIAQRRLVLDGKLVPDQ